MLPLKRQIFINFFKKFSGSQGIPQVMTNPVTVRLAEKYGKTAAQILIRFLFQDDVIALPKSSSPERIKSNFDVSLRWPSFNKPVALVSLKITKALLKRRPCLQIFSFEFTQEEMNELRDLDRGEIGRTFDYLEIFTGIEKHPENPLASSKITGQIDCNSNSQMSTSWTQPTLTLDLEKY